MIMLRLTDVQSERARRRLLWGFNGLRTYSRNRHGPEAKNLLAVGSESVSGPS